MSGSGVEIRMRILREAAEQQILKPFRTHGWEATISLEDESGEYVVINATKAVAIKRVALLYSAATDNRYYRALDTTVDHIFTNGELYHIESFAHGIQTQVTPVDQFFPLLVTWNKVFAPEVQVTKRCRSRTVWHITAESPLESVWARMDQFASVQLAEKLVKRRASEECVSLRDGAAATKATGVAYAIRNARDYFRSLPFENLNKRILSLYYGALALAFAEMLASPSGPSDLDEVEGMTKQGHGLYTVPSANNDLGGLSVGVLATGFFPRWMSFLGHSTNHYPKARAKTRSDLEKMAPGTIASLCELLSTLPELGDLFLEIFSAAPSWVVPALDDCSNAGLLSRGKAGKPSSTYIRLFDTSGRVTSERLLNAGWPIAELTAIPQEADGPSFRVRVDHSGHDYWHEVLPIRHSPFEQRATLILPIFGDVSEYRAIATSILYALSILVRYMPSAWRRVEGGDWDQYLALIRTTVAVFERLLPQEFLEAISDQQIHASQPGSLF